MLLPHQNSLCLFMTDALTLSFYLSHKHTITQNLPVMLNHKQNLLVSKKNHKQLIQYGADGSAAPFGLEDWYPPLTSCRFFCLPSPSLLCPPLHVILFLFLLLFCVVNSSFSAPPNAQPLMRSRYATIRFRFHLDSLKIYFHSFIPAALALCHSIHAFSNNRQH